jgi:hypothetical protein
MDYSIEHLQRRFLKYLCFREDGRYPPIGYSHLRTLRIIRVLTFANI